MAPLVTIAIPTYNRSATVGRAIDSALAQTHERLEVLVGDDASKDETAELLGELADRDARVRVVRRDRNAGMVANMDATLRGATGDYVMLLADDDWLGPRCVERTLAAVQDGGDRGGALGRVAYYRDGAEVAAGQPVALAAADPAERVRAYFDAVNADHGNTWLYALAPRAAVERLSPMRNVLAFDWLHVAERAFSGPIALVEETLIFRELGGVSESTARNVRSSGLPALHAKVPHLVIAREVLADIGWRSPVYEPLGPRGRAALAAACAAAVPRRNARHVLYALLPEAAQERWRARA
jgi:glycosyltransferase involved in cell wall biosynthesis